MPEAPLAKDPARSPDMQTMTSGWLARLGLARREQRAWAYYDLAKSAFETTIMAAILPIYYHDVAAANLPEHLRTAYWGYTTGIALFLIAVVSPLLGAISDAVGAAKRFLGSFLLLGAVASMLLALVGEGDWWLASWLFLVANFGYAGANVFYDSLLPSVARHDEIDRVSTAGFALGYVGGGLLLAVNLAWILSPETFGFPDKSAAVRMSFISVGAWWIGFSIPLMRHVREPAQNRRNGEVGSAIMIGVRRIISTFREIRRYKQALLFLIGFWFYSDGIGTIIKMATIYGREIGIGSTHLIGALLLVQFLGIPATFAFGTIAGRLGTRASIQLSLLVYTAICVLGFFMNQSWHFWALAVLVALVQGGSQALSRSLYATLVPKAKMTEFFGFFSVSARFAGIFGPMLFGVVAQLAGGSRLSILFLISFFLIGMVLLQTVNIEEGRRAAEGTPES